MPESGAHPFVRRLPYNENRHIENRRNSSGITGPTLARCLFTPKGDEGWVA